MPLVPTTKGNRVKYAAAGENTAVAPIPVTENPNNPAAPQGGVGNQPAYIPYYAPNIYQQPGPSSTQTPYWVNSAQSQATSAATPTPAVTPNTGYNPSVYGDSGAVGRRLAGLPVASQSRNKTVVTATPHVWVEQRDVTKYDDNGNPAEYGDTYAVMPDGTVVPLAYAEAHADFYDQKYGAGSATTDSNAYITEYNNMYELSQKTHKGWTPEQHNAWTLKAIGLDNETLFGGGSGSSNSISPLAAWQLQSQNWETALPYQIRAGQEWVPGWEPGGLASAVFGSAGVNYNPDVWKAAISNPPQAPGVVGTSAVSLPTWLAQNAAAQSSAPQTTYPQNIELFKPEQVTNSMLNATKWK